MSVILWFSHLYVFYLLNGVQSGGMNDIGLGEFLVNLCAVTGNLKCRSGAGEKCIEITEHNTSMKGLATRILLNYM